jgi:hypothetical protein
MTTAASKNWWLGLPAFQLFLAARHEGLECLVGSIADRWLLVSFKHLFPNGIGALVAVLAPSSYQVSKLRQSEIIGA